WLRRYAAHQHDPERARKRHSLIDRQVEFERQRAARARSDARLQRLREKARAFGEEPTMWTQAQVEQARQPVNEIFPARIDHLLFQLQFFAENMQKFDVAFLDREPVIDASLNREFARTFNTALEHWKSDKLARLLQRIHFSDGTVASIDDIWA